VRVWRVRAPLFNLEAAPQLETDKESSDLGTLGDTGIRGAFSPQSGNAGKARKDEARA
jgi:hypothetical protein